MFEHEARIIKDEEMNRETKKNISKVHQTTSKPPSVTTFSSTPAETSTEENSMQVTTGMEQMTSKPTKTTLFSTSLETSTTAKQATTEQVPTITSNIQPTTVKSSTTDVSIPFVTNADVSDVDLVSVTNKDISESNDNKMKAQSMIEDESKVSDNDLSILSASKPSEKKSP